MANLPTDDTPCDIQSSTRHSSEPKHNLSWADKDLEKLRRKNQETANPPAAPESDFEDVDVVHDDAFVDERWDEIDEMRKAWESMPELRTGDFYVKV